MAKPRALAKRPRRAMWTPLLLVPLAAACIGDIGGGGTGASSTNPNQIECVKGESDAIAVPLQRINDTQFAEVVKELFGPTVTLEAPFPKPLSGYPYSTYSGANPMGDGQVQSVMEAAEAVAMQVADLVPACNGDELGCA